MVHRLHHFSLPPVGSILSKIRPIPPRLATKKDSIYTSMGPAIFRKFGDDRGRSTGDRRGLIPNSNRGKECTAPHDVSPPPRGPNFIQNSVDS